MNKEIEGIQQVEMMIKGFEHTAGKMKGRTLEFPSDINFWENLITHYKRARDAKVSGRPFVLSGMFVPSELFLAMDIGVIFAEYNSLMTAGGGDFFKYFDIAEGYGISNEICSPHRIAIGLALSKLVPRPDFIVGSATTCDQTLKLYQVLSEIYQCPLYIIDSAYGYDGKTLEYMKSEVRDLIKFLEEQTGQKLDYDRLKEVLKLSKTIYDYWEKNCGLRKTIPCPIGSRDTFKDWGVLMTGAGTPQAISYFENRYKEIKERVDKGIGAAREEKARIAWLYALPLFDMRIANWMQEEYGAVIVTDTFGMVSTDVELDPSDPIDFLAKKSWKGGFVRMGYAAMDTSHMADAMAELCAEFTADAAIVLAHWSCRQYCGTIKLLRDAITSKTGIPFLILDADLCDPRVVSSAQIREKLTEFFDTIGVQKVA